MTETEQKRKLSSCVKMRKIMSVDQRKHLITEKSNKYAFMIESQNQTKNTTTVSTS